MHILMTGGHITPALATMDELKKLNADVRFSVVGRMYAMEGDSVPSAEYHLVKEKGIPFYPIRAGRLQRRFTKYTIPALLRVPVGLMQAYRVLKKVKPDVVVSFGGYVAVPVCVAAKILGIRVVTHEQTLWPGLANRIIAKFADVVALSFEETKKYYPEVKNLMVTGNPIRKEIFEVNGELPFSKIDLPMVYVTCGNQGSHVVNQIVFEHLTALLQFCCVYHQTGKNALYDDFQTGQTLMESLPLELRDRYVAKAYVGPSEIGAVMARSEVIVSRGGVNTMCDVMALGKKDVLIPIAGHKEQAANAAFFAKSGIGVSLTEEEASVQLVSVVKELLAKKVDEHTVAKVKKLVHLDAASRLASVILNQ